MRAFARLKRSPESTKKRRTTQDGDLDDETLPLERMHKQRNSRRKYNFIHLSHHSFSIKNKKRDSSSQQPPQNCPSEPPLKKQKKNRGNYKCSTCGQPKKGHVCFEQTNKCNNKKTPPVPITADSPPSTTELKYEIPEPQSPNALYIVPANYTFPNGYPCQDQNGYHNLIQTIHELQREVETLRSEQNTELRCRNAHIAENTETVHQLYNGFPFHPDGNLAHLYPHIYANSVTVHSPDCYTFGYLPRKVPVPHDGLSDPVNKRQKRSQSSPDISPEDEAFSQDGNQGINESEFNDSDDPSFAKSATPSPPMPSPRVPKSPLDPQATNPMYAEAKHSTHPYKDDKYLKYQQSCYMSSYAVDSLDPQEVVDYEEPNYYYYGDFDNVYVDPAHKYSSMPSFSPQTMDDLFSPNEISGFVNFSY